MDNNNYTLGFKIHTPNIFTDIIPNAFTNPNDYAVLKIPLDLLRGYLGKVAERCAEINDPVLNKLMCELTLYEQSDLTSPNYDENMVNQVSKDFNDFELSKDKKLTKLCPKCKDEMVSGFSFFTCTNQFCSFGSINDFD